MFRPGMRAYLIPLAAGAALATSAFLPWVIVADVPLKGLPDVPALWTLGLGVLAAALAALSMITRRNSRHPLLVVGLAALGILILSLRIMPRLAEERALTVSQAFAIVENHPLESVPNARAGPGIYVGLGAAVVLVAFGLTIVIKRAAHPYVVASPDDDV
jgi:prepilin signal peptidase PulO-like enzyme (type II secretory pathway)